MGAKPQTDSRCLAMWCGTLDRETRLGLYLMTWVDAMTLRYKLTHQYIISIFDFMFAK